MSIYSKRKPTKTFKNTKGNIHPKQAPTRFYLHPWTVLERKVMIIFLLDYFGSQNNFWDVSFKQTSITLPATLSQGSVQKINIYLNMPAVFKVKENSPKNTFKTETNIN